jgi:hypothetical protein
MAKIRTRKTAESHDAACDAAKGKNAVGPISKSKEAARLTRLACRWMASMHDVKHRQPTELALRLVLKGFAGIPSSAWSRDSSTLDLRFELAHALLTACAFLLQRSKHNLVDVSADAGQLRRRGEAAERQLAGEHLVKDDAEAVDVRTMIDAARLLDLLWSHVGCGAELGAALREQRRRRLFHRGSSRCRSRRSSRLPLVSSRMFSGLMSRCKTPCVCAN